ncbi:Serine/threonine-protein kinase shk2 [Porphyridium purpureum]|uniref:Serine/threonine-protein kinase shk2 n=1 Tax=Porphyridium purpureum TaxID=35688 RepID=A0A5J4Z2N5_PORPP|nr:Serine/threonine-protein kinase shk2 [Porphyridium purpureum]|eukprot:POR8355..scf208_2
MEHLSKLVGRSQQSAARLKKTFHKEASSCDKENAHGSHAHPNAPQNVNGTKRNAELKANAAALQASQAAAKTIRPRSLTAAEPGKVRTEVTASSQTAGKKVGSELPLSSDACSNVSAVSNAPPSAAGPAAAGGASRTRMWNRKSTSMSDVHSKSQQQFHPAVDKPQEQSSSNPEALFPRLRSAASSKRPQPAKDMVIGMPIQFEHTTHVAVDPTNPTGFSGLPVEWEKLLLRVGVTQREIDAASEGQIADLMCLQQMDADTGKQDYLGFEIESEGESATHEGKSRPKSKARNRGMIADEIGGGIVMWRQASERKPELGALATVTVKSEDPFDRRYNQFSDVVEIGAGSCGSVYRALHKGMGAVALKCCTIDDDYDMMLVVREMAVMRTVKHPNVVAMHQCFRREKKVWVQMEYMDGGSLYSLLKTLHVKHADPTPAESGLDPSMHGRKSYMRLNSRQIKAERAASGITGLRDEFIAYILLNVLQGLKAMHDRLIMHRDIKSDNILLDSSGNVKIADMGFSVALDDDEDYRKSVIGTPFWMAPEVIRGRRYTTGVDVWSVGILAVELISTLPVYYGDQTLRAMFRIAMEGVLDTYQVRAIGNASPGLHNFIGRCCQMEPSKRATVDELLEHDFLKKACSKEAFMGLMVVWLAQKQTASPSMCLAQRNARDRCAGLQQLTYLEELSIKTATESVVEPHLIDELRMPSQHARPRACSIASDDLY